VRCHACWSNGPHARPTHSSAMAPVSLRMKGYASTMADTENPSHPEQNGDQIPQYDAPESRRSGQIEDAPQSDPWYNSPRWKRIVQTIPAPVARRGRIVIRWIKGPVPSRQNRIKPLFEPIQTLHIRLFARFPRAASVCIFICVFMLWIVLFGVILSTGGLPQDIGGVGTPIRLSCIARLWYV